MILKNLNLPRIGNVEEMYEDKLHELPMFAGGFINFGYWTQCLESQKKLSEKDRVNSQKNLYRIVSKKLDINSLDRVLEVGCGLGVGARLISEEFNTRAVIGIDSSEHQVNRAKEKNKLFSSTSTELKFFQGYSSSMPFDDNSFSKLISIEAVQHFDSFDNFVKESYRVLRPNGKIGIATFFGLNHTNCERAAQLIPTIANGVDKLLPIEKTRKKFEEVGFINVEMQSIGKNVWPFLNKWIEQGELQDSWDRNWITGYNEGLYDYYIILARK